MLEKQVRQTLISSPFKQTFFLVQALQILINHLDYQLATLNSDRQLTFVFDVLFLQTRKEVCLSAVAAVLLSLINGLYNNVDGLCYYFKDLICKALSITFLPPSGDGKGCPRQFKSFVLQSTGAQLADPPILHPLECGTGNQLPDLKTPVDSER